MAGAGKDRKSGPRTKKSSWRGAQRVFLWGQQRQKGISCGEETAGRWRGRALGQPDQLSLFPEKIISEFSVRCNVKCIRTCITYSKIKPFWCMSCHVLVAQLCLVLCYFLDCSPPGSSVHRIFQARMRSALPLQPTKASFWPRDGSHVFCVSCIGRQILYHCSTWEAYFPV